MASLQDAYELGGVAGQGRTTRVRLAVRHGDARPVALKQLRTEHLEYPDRHSRFVRQAHRASMLEHDNVEEVLDIVESPDGPVMVTEWVDGRSLQRLAAGERNGGRPWDPRIVAFIARCILEALRHVHHNNTMFDGEVMVHGGLTPRNVMIDVDGRVKVVDFGMAAVWQEALEPWQDLEALRYLSAEHVRHGATPGADLYAVGAIVHELLSGLPFRDECETEEEMRAAIDRLEPPPRPREEVPQPLERLRRRLLEPVPNPRVTLEHMLDLCAAIPMNEAPDDLRRLVRDALRNDSTQPDVGPPADAARSRTRVRARAHAAAGSDHVEQVPLGGGARRRPGRETRSVPVPVDHEKTAARTPQYLRQTAPPTTDEARDAELRRSGALDSEGGAPETVLDQDTAPLPVEAGAPVNVEDPEPAPVPPYSGENSDEWDDLEDPDVTAEVEGAPRMPGEAPPRRRRPTPPPAAAPAPWQRLRSPLGLVLLGAIVALVLAVILRAVVG